MSKMTEQKARAHTLKHSVDCSTLMNPCDSDNFKIYK